MTGYSVPVPHSASEDGLGEIRRSASGVPPVLALTSAGGSLVYTSYENFRAAVAKFPTNAYLGRRESSTGGFTWQSYREVAERVDAFAAGLKQLGCLDFGARDADLRDRPVLGLFSVNRPEWTMAEQACYCYNAVPVPFYDSLTADVFALLVNKIPSLRAVLCDEKTVKVAAQAKTRVKFVILPDDVFSASAVKTTVSELTAAGVTVLSFTQVEQTGRPLYNTNKNLLFRHTPPSPDDVFTFCFTSGTTGEPKGALITQQSLMANLAALTAAMFAFRADDVHLSYLPLPHMLERTVQAVITWAGAAIGFFSGDPLRLLEDLQWLRPTVFPSVPRVLNRIKERVDAQLGAALQSAGGAKQQLYSLALSQKASGGLLADLLDFVVLRKIRNTLGFDRLRGVVTGSAPISPVVLTWLRLVLDVPVLEGYGMTECTLVATLQGLGDQSTGNVGGPLSSAEIRLVDVPEMGYRTTDKTHDKINGIGGRGEIWIRGPTVFRGYYKMPKETSETVTAAGWLKTGDIGVWLPDGQLKIVDRKKNIFKLSNGEYVSGEKVENVISQSKFVLQSFVYGNSYQRFLVALVVLNPETVPANGRDEAAVNQDEHLKKAVLADIQRVSVANKLLGFEIVKNVHLLLEPWTPSNFLTPTFKLKRNEVTKHYQQTLDGLYLQLQQQQQSKI